MPTTSNFDVAEEHQYNEVELPACVEIQESKVSPDQPGAFCKTFIMKDTRFGPYKGEIINPGQKADIDYRYAWEIFEKRRKVLKYTISALNSKTSNWMRNVNCARFYEEQNIVSTQEGFSIFYIAMKDIKPGEELLTWFDPQLLKRKQRRMSKGERKRVGYTIELVPWSDEKKFVPEIIETKRARKKKILGDDMLCFEEDAALMQKSMNSMFRIPKKTDNQASSNKDYLHSGHGSKVQEVSPYKKVTQKLSSPASQSFKRDTKDGFSSIAVPSSQIACKEKQVSLPAVSYATPVKTEVSSENPSHVSQMHHKRDLVRKRSRGRPSANTVKKYMETIISDTKKVLDSTIGFNPNDPNLLKPVIIRTKDDGTLEIEDHDETYDIPCASIRQECDDLCLCLDKKGLIDQDHDKSSLIHKGNDEIVVHFTLLPEHQTFALNNKVIYKCDICESSYNHAFSLKRHYLGIHINHRYLTKEDVNHCQLETFHNGANEEDFKDKDVLCQGQINVPSLDDTSNKEKHYTDNKRSNAHQIVIKANDQNPYKSTALSQEVPKSLLCDETLSDAGKDELKRDVPTLRSLAHSQINICSSKITDTDSLNCANQNKTDSLLNSSSISSPSMKGKLDNENSLSTKEEVDTEKCKEDLSSDKNFFTQSSGVDNGNQQHLYKLSLSASGNHAKEDNCVNALEKGKANIPKKDNSEEENGKVEKNGGTEEKENYENTSRLSAHEEIPLKNEQCGEVKIPDVNVKVNEKSDIQGDRQLAVLDRVELKPSAAGKPVTNCVIEGNKNVTSKENDDQSEINLNDRVVTQAAHKGDGEGELKNDFKVENALTSQAQLPVSTALVPANSITNPQPQQQFLLLLPILSTTNKLSQTPHMSVSTNSSTLPKSQGLPLVVIPPQVSTSASTIPLQSPMINNKIGPQILSSHTVPISSASSNHVQSITFLSHNNNVTPPNSLQSTNNSNMSLSTPGTSGAATTKSSHQNLSHSMSVTNQNPVKVQEGDQPCDLYRCHMCVLVYKTMGELKHHIRNDPHRFKGGFKQYACPKCSVRFRNKTNLARHTLMHHLTSDDKDRKFRCLTCGKGFTTETYLKMHARFHLGKSFPCKYGCVETYFPNAGSLVKHLRAVHPGLDLKQYLRDKARKERMKRLDSVKTSTDYNIDHPGVGFQAKRGRPKGSKNMPKELKLLLLQNKKGSKSTSPKASFEEEEKPIMTESVSTSENFEQRDQHFPIKKFFPIEKSWQKGHSFFQKERIVPTENTQESVSVVQRKFRCQLCNASFQSYLCLLKHRSKRHGASQSVQEFLYEMAKDQVEESCTDSETYQFSPPPSPKTFFANVNERGAENMSKYIEGNADMLKCRRQLSFCNNNSQPPLSMPPQLEWTRYNFPPCFRYVRDSTMFYDSSMGNFGLRRKYEIDEEPKSETDIHSHDNVSEDLIESTVEKTEPVIEMEGYGKVMNDVTNDKAYENINDSHKDTVDGSLPVNLEEKKHGDSSLYSFQSNDECLEKFDNSVSSVKAGLCEKTDIVLSGATAELLSKSQAFIDSENSKSSNTKFLSASLDDSYKSEKVVLTSDLYKRYKRSPKKDRTEKHDLMNRLNKASLKALDLEVGTKYCHRHLNFSEISVLDSLNLFLKEPCEKSTKKLFVNRKRTMSACSLLLFSKKLCRSQGSLFNSPDMSKHEHRRVSIWQGPHYSKADTKASEKFCCPVVEYVRQQNVMKKRKEIDDENDKQIINIKPKQKYKEDFAKNIGLMTRRDFGRSYYAQEKTEHCIKPPEVWESYNHIWFGKKGTITVVCSICHRHFSCLELCLRHQLKKHPHIEPSSLAMERGNYVEDMYYYYPMPYGILAQTHLIPDKLPPPEVYACTRCKFPFKTLNKLHAHMLSCDPYKDNSASKNVIISIDKKPSVTTSKEIQIYAHIPQSVDKKPSRQRMLTNKFKNYQLLSKSSLLSSKYKSCTSSQHTVVTKGPAAVLSSKSQGFMSIPRRKRNQHGLLYNPSNHTRRREQSQLLDQHQCLGCKLKFNSMSMLERHVKNCSGKDKLQNQKPLLSGVADEMTLRKQHICRYCNKRFTFIKGVDLHYKRICSIRKIREEENQLTEEDLAHEAELERIIEHLKWSKSFNKDSSDIIQGHVKVEEDGTLIRVEKKRGRPFGTGRRRIRKKKGFRWTTLKHHRQEEDSSVASSGHNTPKVVDHDQNSLDEKRFKESLEQALSTKVTKAFVEIETKGPDKIDQERKSVKEMNTSKLTDQPKPPPRKRGRPFKNQNREVVQNSNEPKKMRGRPKKGQEKVNLQTVLDEKVQAQCLKDGIKYKRGECAKEKISTPKKEMAYPCCNEKPEAKISKLPDAEKRQDECLSQTDSTLKKEKSIVRNDHLEQANENVSNVGTRKRKLEDSIPVKPPSRVRGRPKKFDPEPITDAIKPPPRVRGCPKKFDPSDLESSYKKKKKTDPAYISLVRNTSGDSPKNSSQKRSEQERMNTKSHANGKLDQVSSPERKSQSEIAKGIFNEESKVCHQPTNKPERERKSSSHISVDKEAKKDANLTPEIETASQTLPHNKSSQITLKKSPDVLKSVKKTNKESLNLDTNISHYVGSESLKSKSIGKLPKDCDDSVSRKRKKQNTPSEDPELKKSKGTVSEALESRERESLKKKDTLSGTSEYLDQKQESKVIIVSPPEPKVSVDEKKSQHASMSPTSTNGNLVQTPVAVRIVTLPASAAQQLSSLGGMKIIKPPETSSCLSPKVTCSSSSTSPAHTSTVISSPLMKLSFSRQNSPQTSSTTNTVVNTMSGTTTNITMAGATPTTKSQDIRCPQTSAFPMAQVIPIENRNVLVSPEAAQTGVGSRFIIQPSPLKTVVPSNQGQTQVPISNVTSPTRQVAASAVILSTGKVAPLTGTFISSGNIIQSPVMQQGKKILKIGNVISPVGKTSSSPMLSPSLTRPMIRKEKTIISPPISSLPGSAGSPRPIYYVKKPQLSSQMNSGSNKVLLNLGDGKTKVVNTIAMPQVQFIPVSVVQGISPNPNLNAESEQPSSDSGNAVTGKNEVAKSQENHDNRK